MAETQKLFMLVDRPPTQRCPNALRRGTFVRSTASYRRLWPIIQIDFEKLSM